MSKLDGTATWSLSTLERAAQREICPGVALGREDALLEPRGRFYQRKLPNLPSRPQSRADAAASGAVLGVPRRRGAREFVQLVVEQVEHDSVELLAIHGSILQLSLGSSQGSCVLFEIAQCFLESVERITHPTLHCVLSDAGDFGDLLEGQVGHFAQQEHFALFVWELVAYLRMSDALVELPGPSLDGMPRVLDNARLEGLDGQREGVRYRWDRERRVLTFRRLQLGGGRKALASGSVRFDADGSAALTWRPFPWTSPVAMGFVAVAMLVADGGPLSLVGPILPFVLAFMYLLLHFSSKRMVMRTVPVLVAIVQEKVVPATQKA